jgi:hypothetical protein
MKPKHSDELVNFIRFACLYCGPWTFRTAWSELYFFPLLSRIISGNVCLFAIASIVIRMRFVLV